MVSHRAPLFIMVSCIDSAIYYENYVSDALHIRIFFDVHRSRQADKLQLDY